MVVMCRTRLIVVVYLFLLNSPAVAQSLNEVLGAVSKNVKEFQDQLPDFVCNERVTSRQFDSGRMRKENRRLAKNGYHAETECSLIFF